MNQHLIIFSNTLCSERAENEYFNYLKYSLEKIWKSPNSVSFLELILRQFFISPKRWWFVLSGRAKIKKIALPLIAAAGVKLFALIPIVLGSLGLLVMKALFVGKIALLLAGVLAFQRLFGSGNGATSLFNKNNQPSTVGWVDNSGGQGWSSNIGTNVQPQGYYRSFNDRDGRVDAHSMAYSAQAPITNETN